MKKVIAVLVVLSLGALVFAAMSWQARNKGCCEAESECCQ
jgi:hypothetical protein